MTQAIDTIADTLADGPLSQPLRLGKLDLPNRIVMAPMTRYLSSGGVPGEDVARYYARRAEAGVGLLITEGAWIPHPSATNDPAAPDLFGEAALAGWKRVVDQVHAVRGRIVAQLWHVGLVRKQSSAAFPAGEPAYPHQIGPSGLTGGYNTPIVQVREPMTLAEIDAVIDAYATASTTSQALGFDGIEIHAAHGYLIDQFFWNQTNTRSDRYGGDIRARSTFAAEIVAEIRRRVGPDYPILFRFSQWKTHDYDAIPLENPAELEAMLGPIADAGVDMFHASTRRFWEPAFAGSELNLAGWAKKLSGKMSMTVGSIGVHNDFRTALRGEASNLDMSRLQNLVQRVERGEFDLVAVGRSLLSDASWWEKVKAGRFEDIVPFTRESIQTLS